LINLGISQGNKESRIIEHRQSAKISIFIPAYNAEMHLESVIARIPEAIWPEIQNVWIINDGSTDRTQQIVESLSTVIKKIKPVHFPQNRGYGAAVKQGLALCKEDMCDVAVCLHSDGQYPPEEIGRFTETVAAQEIDILQGSRIASNTALSGGMPVYKYIAGKMLTFFENRVFGLSLTDYHSGFMCYSRRALHGIPFEKLSASFDFDVEVIASARARRMKVGELPIPTRYADEKSHLHPVSYGFRILGVMAKYLQGRYRQ
jgi:glycosyltransferase involved in cell wall biosynthesis